MGDFSVCPHGPCGVRSADQEAVVKRLEDLMRRCREEQHALTYSDLIDVQFGPVPNTFPVPEVKS